MALSLAEIIILCLLADWLFKRFRVPGLVGMLFAGILLGPAALDLLKGELLVVGADLRSIALVVILLRAGFELSREALNKVGLQALLLAFVPALFEIAAVSVLGPVLLGLSTLESVLLGCVLGAVSPAVVVPMMVRFNEERRGTAKGIPTLVLAAASIDDVVVIVAFSVALGIYTGSGARLAWKLAGIPLAIVAGAVTGLVLGSALFRLFDRFNPRATKRALAVIGVSILLVQLGERLEALDIPFAPLIAVMAIGFVILEKRESMAHELSAKLGKIWVFAEIILFALVGAQVRLEAAAQAGFAGAALVLLALVARSAGTWLSTLGSPLTARERLFVVISYLPKATVQAAIGSVPLAAMAARGMPTAAGETILAVAVMSIVLTAPTGAWAIAWAGGALLTRDDAESASAARAAALESDALEDDEER
ncbi:MAG: cation:proton antiporter [Spirochaetales bacterium]|nr:cation:proton antiporter [Spirochaetales bacterium]